MLKPLLAACALLACAAALANDSTAELAAGGLVLTRTDAIEMRSEDLHISRSQIRVRYQFVNTSGRDTTVRVAFPLPAIGGPGFFDGDVAIPIDGTDNFLGFSTQVDGKPVAMEIEHKALVGTTDRTGWLRANAIPLRPHADETETALARLTPARRREAVQLGLIDDNDRPGWTLQTTYHWLQRFPAGMPVAIEHVYRPSVGGTVATLLGSDAKDPNIARYCVDPPLLATLRAAEAKQRHYRENWVDYILVTGGNWKKPIGSFRLVVDKEDPRDLVSFCGDGVRKIGPTRFEMRKTNWRPDRDLAVLFLAPAAL
ncbi:DUF4424 domain-containing protein [Sphingomonas sp. LM7]|uniref:DUF4424 domain-containing protein n=1 Tax=Sphingomonas sp. LM7 TaxID=1938607 RepID=UPI000983B5CB|nr:DUF4424 domain-containing protein [Sphingomonas sp. LM7]AQR73658.1 hypothetical protein BXU08_08415 [Sphingomonas sp. LM7]